jgi:flagellar protein FlbD
MIGRMICLTRLDGSEIIVNTDLILTVESTPDTMLTLVTGGHILVKESVKEVVERSMGYRQRIYRGPAAWELSAAAAAPFPPPTPERKE